MNLQDKTIEGILVLTITSPQLDYTFAEDFKLGVADCLRRGHERLVIDMSQVNFMDSSGLGALVSCLKRVGDPKRMLLCNVAPPVVSLFKLTRMDQVFIVYPSEQDALAALRA
jgi:anti-sigma B factor antagonist